MSVIFGIRRPQGEIVNEEELLHLAANTERYAPDGTYIRAQGRIGMGFQPYHTTVRSRMEAQPVVDRRGNMLVFDGRLDNHEKLRRELGFIPANDNDADSELLLAAFLRWGKVCFSRFLGDWAIAFWSAKDQTLYLARDHAGTRTLYFQSNGANLLWSTYLEQFAAMGSAGAISEQYAACYLGSLSTGDLTPYPGVLAVPPAHYLVIHQDKVRIEPHWQWMAHDKIRYNTDEEYERHFFSLFQKAVERRSGPGAPILAELSGGMDSTTIVCMSDYIRRSENPGAELLDTLSYYDDAEPNANERPYFSITEARRGKLGIHIEASYVDRGLEPVDPARGVYLLPGADSTTVGRETDFLRQIGDKNYRVILSGLGGDELLGGVPTPSPELAGHLVAGKLKLLLSQAAAWCISNRTTIWEELFGSAKFAADLYRRPHADRKALPPWLTPRLRKLYFELGRRDIASGRCLGLPPSAIANGRCWWVILETLPHRVPEFLFRPEYRYPYLDRDLVDFLFRVPREQLVRPGRKRSLMRRAVKDIVPTEILENRRKLFYIKGPLTWLQVNKEQIEAMFADSCTAEYGFIEPKALCTALETTTRGVDPTWCRALMNTISFELWLNSRNGRRLPVRSNKFVLQHEGASKIRADQIAS
jgi:asparagine synthase (glutamine-hydrolysing)